MTEFVLTDFVRKMTGYVLNMSKIRFFLLLNMALLDDDDDDESNGMAYMSFYCLSYSLGVNV